MKDESGPAFPIAPQPAEPNQHWDCTMHREMGLTKREWGAFMIASGMLANRDCVLPDRPENRKQLAGCIRAMTDDLLAELNKERPDHDAK